MAIKDIKKGDNDIKLTAKALLEHFGNIVGKSIWQILLVIVIILNIMDFFEILNPDLDYMKKIISWTVLGYLLYNVDLAKIIFGTSNKKFDLYLILTFFMMFIKDFLLYSTSILEEMKIKGITAWGKLVEVKGTDVLLEGKNHVINIQTDIYGNLSTVSKDTLNPVLHKITQDEAINQMASNLTIDPSSAGPVLNSIYINISNNASNIVLSLEPKYSVHRWHSFITDNNMMIQTIPFLIGIICLILLSIYATRKIEIKDPSMMHIIHFERLRNIKYFSPAIRFIMIFLVLNFFFITLFSFMMEWLAIAIDASLLVAGIFFYIWLNITHKHRFNAESLLIKIGDIGADFYERFVKLFHSKKGILLAFSGLIVLHLLVDVGIFLIPHTTGLHDSLYFEHLNKETHQPIFNILFFTDGYSSIFTDDIQSNVHILQRIAVFPIYILNLTSLLFLLVIPAFLWYSLLKEKEFYISDFIVALFYSSMFVFLLLPAIKIGRIVSNSLNGIDIMTRSVINNSFNKIFLVFILAIIIYIIIRILFLKFAQVKKYFVLFGIIISFIFLGYYIYIYIIENIVGYFNLIDFTVSQIAVSDVFHKIMNILFSIEFGIFFILILFFYIIGYIIFAYEVIKA